MSAHGEPAAPPATPATPVTAAPADPRAVDVVVHTHWDREWYLSRETTLARLQAVVEEVLAQLDGGALPSFLFDGQTVALRDLLAVAPPPLAARVQAHARAGRLVLGPWYVSADEFLVSGESLLRNLEFGLADAARLGPPQRLGYLPDTFGHVAQMPQILAQFGIEAAVVWRGADLQHDRFDWIAPDGTRVGGVFLPEGYYLHPLHGPAWREELDALLARLAARRAPEVGGALLLPHGGDHLAPHALLHERVRAFNAAQQGYVLRFTTLQEHVQALLARPGPRETRHGELRRNEQAFVLPDVLSARRGLKLAHQLAEDRLLGETEPLLARVAPPGAPPPAGLERAWRTLIEQQAHDSICGCSIDAVHEEMAQRFVSLGQLLDALRTQALHAAGFVALHRHAQDAAAARAHEDPRGLPDVFADDRRCTLFNPLPRAARGWHAVQLFLRGPLPRALRVCTPEGGSLPAVVAAWGPAGELVSPLDDFPERLEGHRLELLVEAEIPGLGQLALEFVDAEPGQPGACVLPGTGSASDPAAFPSAAPAAPTAALIENAAWRVEHAADGRLVLTDRLQGCRVEGALAVLSELDAGDSYTFSPPAGLMAPAGLTHAPAWELAGVHRAGTLQEMQLVMTLQLPAALDADRRWAASARVTCEGRLRLRLVGQEPVLHVDLVWHNAAQDQRTRLLLPGLSAALACTWSDTAFAWSARPVRLASLPEAPSRREMPVVVQPSLGAVVAGPWAVAHRALHEHEIVSLAALGLARADDPGLALALTLVRSVGWLSRRDLRTRGVGAGPDLPTPGAQSLGSHPFALRLVAGVAATQPAAALAHAAALRRPVLLLRGHAPAQAGPVAAVDHGNELVQTSSVRRLPDGRLELRLWNPTEQVQPLTLHAGEWEAVLADDRPDPHAPSVAPVAPVAAGAPGAPAAAPQAHCLRPCGLLTLRQRLHPGRGAVA
ncbi:MAG: hypothetical protein ACOYLV_10430 [Rubrivivax sp.]